MSTDRAKGSCTCWDYRRNKDLTLFAEIYDDEETAVISEEKGDLTTACVTYSSGHVLAVGLCYSFSNR